MKHKHKTKYCFGIWKYKNCQGKIYLTVSRPTLCTCVETVWLLKWDDTLAELW